MELERGGVERGRWAAAYNRVERPDSPSLESPVSPAALSPPARLLPLPRTLRSSGSGSSSSSSSAVMYLTNRFRSPHKPDQLSHHHPPASRTPTQLPGTSLFLPSHALTSSRWRNAGGWRVAGGLLYFPRCLGFLASLDFLGFLGFLSFLGFSGFWDSGAGEGRRVAEPGVSGEGAVAGGAVRDLGSMASWRVLGLSVLVVASGGESADGVEWCVEWIRARKGVVKGRVWMSMAE